MKYKLNRDVGGYTKDMSVRLRGHDCDVSAGVEKGGWYEVDTNIFNTWLTLGWLDEVKEEPKSVWELKEGDKCFSIGISGDIYEDQNTDTHYVSDHLDVGNVFLTRESAERELEIRKKMAKEAKEGLGLK